MGPFDNKHYTNVITEHVRKNNIIQLQLLIRSILYMIILINH